MSDPAPPKDTPHDQFIEGFLAPGDRYLKTLFSALSERKEPSGKPVILSLEETPAPVFQSAHKPSDGELQACLTQYSKPRTQKP